MNKPKLFAKKPGGGSATLTLRIIRAIALVTTVLSILGFIVGILILNYGLDLLSNATEEAGTVGFILFITSVVVVPVSAVVFCVALVAYFVTAKILKKRTLTTAPKHSS